MQSGDAEWGGPPPISMVTLHLRLVRNQHTEGVKRADVCLMCLDQTLQV